MVSLVACSDGGTVEDPSRNDSDSAHQHTDSVYQVVQMVGAHPTSWEEAAQLAISEATKTIVDLRVAQVVQTDTLVIDGAVSAYRIKLKLSYRIDHRRTTAEGLDVDVTRVLIVANQSVANPALTKTIQQRLDQGPCEFHVLVPATYSKSYSQARRLSSFAADPSTGYVADLGVFAGEDSEGQDAAHERLADRLDMLAAAGTGATGEVGDADPLRAISAVLTRSVFDEIILSTLPASISKWLSMDLPSRIERRFGIPVTHVGTVDSR